MSIKITGLEQIQAKLKKLESKIDGSEMKKTLNSIGLKVKGRILDSFEDEKSPFGEPWKPLEESTKKAKAKKNQSSKILNADGDLSRSSRWVVSPSENKVTISNNITSNDFAYGLTHQFGSSNAWGRGIKVPKRPFLPVGDDGVFEQSLKDDILGFLDDEFDRVLN